MLSLDIAHECFSIDSHCELQNRLPYKLTEGRKKIYRSVQTRKENGVSAFQPVRSITYINFGLKRCFLCLEWLQSCQNNQKTSILPRIILMFVSNTIKIISMNLLAHTHREKYREKLYEFDLARYSQSAYNIYLRSKLHFTCKPIETTMKWDAYWANIEWNFSLIPSSWSSENTRAIEIKDALIASVCFLLSFDFAMAFKDFILLQQMKQKIETTWIEHTYTHTDIYI